MSTLDTIQTVTACTAILMNKRDAKHWFNLGAEVGMNKILDIDFNDDQSAVGEKLEQSFEEAWKKEKSIRKKVKEC